MPTRGIASRLIGKIFVVEEPAANFTPADSGGGFDISQLEAVAFDINVRAGGTQGDVNVTFQKSTTTDANASYSAIPDSELEVPKGQTPAPSSGVVAIDETHVGRRYYGFKGNAKFIRAITSGAAGTPDFAVSVGASGYHRRHING